MLLPSRPYASVTDTDHLLETVVRMERPTRVILDVDDTTEAAVFVNHDNELSVVDRQGRVELLQTSSYTAQLDSCLVFLDEAHTRGIDLRLPCDYRAAVILGANVTKEKLVQACIRLRKLGKGQSVVFCVNAEIRAKIQECTAKSADKVIEVKDILHWAISETFAEVSARVDGVTTMSQMHAERFLEDEAQSLAARYDPCLAEGTSRAGPLRSGSWKSGEIRKRCDEFGHLHLNPSTLEEEQERELSPETEQERQVQRPAPARPADHSLHPDIVKFVATGRLMPGSSAYMRAFDTLRNTSAADNFDASQLDRNGRLFVTADFATTVEASGRTSISDAFQPKGSRAVDVIMVISPYEAEELLPNLQLGKASLHLYKPRCHTGHCSFDRLDFFTIPARPADLAIPRPLLIELNLFAGQLYFSEFEDYLETCRFLGLATDVPSIGEVVAADGYIFCNGNGKSKFEKSPVQFLQILTSKIRRNGQGISRTHVGKMLEGKLLQRSDVDG
ncbi:hypothetical protein F4778DRAFT_800368 [Xylariomycetidae sp. FL2044]|nr:hypothetical protein F4778DRAFT_800368 [Xylariomycetidae sp. FL2044]